MENNSKLLYSLPHCLPQRHKINDAFSMLLSRAIAIRSFTCKIYLLLSHMNVDIFALFAALQRVPYSCPPPPGSSDPPARVSCPNLSLPPPHLPATIRRQFIHYYCGVPFYLPVSFEIDVR